MLHADKPTLSWCTQKNNCIHKVNLATNISEVWGGSKPEPAKVKKDSTHIFAEWNPFSTTEKGVVLVLWKKHAPWQHHYGVELALVRLLVQSTQSHGQPCLQLNKSFCFSSPRTVEPSWLVICLSQSSDRFTWDWLRSSRTATSTIIGTRQTHSNPFLWQGAKTTHPLRLHIIQISVLPRVQLYTHSSSGEVVLQQQNVEKGRPLHNARHPTQACSTTRVKRK